MSTPKTVGQGNALPYGSLLLLNLGIWVAVSAVIRLWGHHFFIPSLEFSMAGNFLADLLLLPVLTLGILNRFQIPRSQRSEAALVLVLPGIVLDAISIYFFPIVFPNLDPSAGMFLGSWLLWGNGVVLITGLVSGWPQTGLFPAGDPMQG